MHGSPSLSVRTDQLFGLGFAFTDLGFVFGFVLAKVPGNVRLQLAHALGLGLSDALVFILSPTSAYLTTLN